MMPLLTDSVLAEVRAERERQHARWGEQNLPDGTGSEQQRQAAVNAKDLCARVVATGRLTWVVVLAEEVCEALGESDPERLRAELIQVAAVAVQWVEALDRRRPLQ